MACWSWTNLGALPEYGGQFGVITDDAPRRVYYSFADDDSIYAASYPSLDNLNRPSAVDNYGVHTFTSGTQGVHGIALDGSDIYVLVNNSSPSQSELWQFTVGTHSSTGQDAQAVGTLVGDWSDSNPWGTIGTALAFNPADGLLYAVNSWDDSLYTIDPSTGSRSLVFTHTFGVNLDLSVSVTPDGAVWVVGFGSPTHIARYDPSTDQAWYATSSSTSSWMSALALADSAVLVHRYGGVDSQAGRFHFTGSMIDDEHYTLADIDGTLGPFWQGTYDGHVFDGDDLWLADTTCPGGPSVGFIKFGSW